MSTPGLYPGIRELREAIDLLAECPTHGETPGLASRDDALDMLIMAARYYRQEVITNEGAWP